MGGPAAASSSSSSSAASSSSSSVSAVTPGTQLSSALQSTSNFFNEGVWNFHSSSLLADCPRNASVANARCASTVWGNITFGCRAVGRWVSELGYDMQHGVGTGTSLAPRRQAAIVFYDHQRNAADLATQIQALQAEQTKIENRATEIDGDVRSTYPDNGSLAPLSLSAKIKSLIEQYEHKTDGASLACLATLLAWQNELIELETQWRRLQAKIKVKREQSGQQSTAATQAQMGGDQASSASAAPGSEVRFRYTDDESAPAAASLTAPLLSQTPSSASSVTPLLDDSEREDEAVLASPPPTASDSALAIASIPYLRYQSRGLTAKFPAVVLGSLLGGIPGIVAAAGAQHVKKALAYGAFGKLSGLDRPGYEVYRFTQTVQESIQPKALATYEGNYIFDETQKKLFYVRQVFYVKSYQLPLVWKDYKNSIVVLEENGKTFWFSIDKEGNEPTVAYRPGLPERGDILEAVALSEATNFAGFLDGRITADGENTKNSNGVSIGKQVRILPEELQKYTSAGGYTHTSADPKGNLRGALGASPFGLLPGLIGFANIGRFFRALARGFVKGIGHGARVAFEPIDYSERFNEVERRESAVGGVGMAMGATLGAPFGAVARVIVDGLVGLWDAFASAALAGFHLFDQKGPYAIKHFKRGTWAERFNYHIQEKNIFGCIGMIAGLGLSIFGAACGFVARAVRDVCAGIGMGIAGGITTGATRHYADAYQDREVGLPTDASTASGSSTSAAASSASAASAVPAVSVIGWGLTRPKLYWEKNASSGAIDFVFRTPEGTEVKGSISAKLTSSHFSGELSGIQTLSQAQLDALVGEMGDPIPSPTSAFESCAAFPDTLLDNTVYCCDNDPAHQAPIAYRFKNQQGTVFTGSIPRDELQMRENESLREYLRGPWDTGRLLSAIKKRRPPSRERAGFFLGGTLGARIKAYCREGQVGKAIATAVVGSVTYAITSCVKGFFDAWRYATPLGLQIASGKRWREYGAQMGHHLAHGHIFAAATMATVGVFTGIIGAIGGVLSSLWHGFSSGFLTGWSPLAYEFYRRKYETAPAALDDQTLYLTRSVNQISYTFKTAAGDILKGTVNLPENCPTQLSDLDKASHTEALRQVLRQIQAKHPGKTNFVEIAGAGADARGAWFTRLRDYAGQGNVAAIPGTIGMGIAGFFLGGFFRVLTASAWMFADFVAGGLASGFSPRGYFQCERLYEALPGDTSQIKKGTLYLTLNTDGCSVDYAFTPPGRGLVRGTIRNFFAAGQAPTELKNLDHPSYGPQRRALLEKISEASPDKTVFAEIAGAASRGTLGHRIDVQADELGNGVGFFTPIQIPTILFPIPVFIGATLRLLRDAFWGMVHGFSSGFMSAIFPLSHAVSRCDYTNFPDGDPTRTDTVYLKKSADGSAVEYKVRVGDRSYPGSIPKTSFGFQGNQALPQDLADFESGDPLVVHRESLLLQAIAADLRRQRVKGRVIAADAASPGTRNTTSYGTFGRNLRMHARQGNIGAFPSLIGFGILGGAIGGALSSIGNFCLGIYDAFKRMWISADANPPVSSNSNSSSSSPHPKKGYLDRLAQNACGGNIPRLVGMIVAWPFSLFAYLRRINFQWVKKACVAIGKGYADVCMSGLGIAKTGFFRCNHYVRDYKTNVWEAPQESDSAVATSSTALLAGSRAPEAKPGRLYLRKKVGSSDVVQYKVRGPSGEVFSGDLPLSGFPDNFSDLEETKNESVLQDVLQAVSKRHPTLRMNETESIGNEGTPRPSMLRLRAIFPMIFGGFLGPVLGVAGRILRDIFYVGLWRGVLNTIATAATPFVYDSPNLVVLEDNDQALPDDDLVKKTGNLYVRKKDGNTLEYAICNSQGDVRRGEVAEAELGFTGDETLDVKALKHRSRNGAVKKLLRKIQENHSGEFRFAKIAGAEAKIDAVWGEGTWWENFKSKMRKGRVLPALVLLTVGAPVGIFTVIARGIVDLFRGAYDGIAGAIVSAWHFDYTDDTEAKAGVDERGTFRKRLAHHVKLGNGCAVPMVAVFGLVTGIVSGLARMIFDGLRYGAALGAIHPRPGTEDSKTWWGRISAQYHHYQAKWGKPLAVVGAALGGICGAVSAAVCSVGRFIFDFCTLGVWDGIAGGMHQGASQNRYSVNYRYHFGQTAPSAFQDKPDNLSVLEHAEQQGIYFERKTDGTGITCTLLHPTSGHRVSYDVSAQALELTALPNDLEKLTSPQRRLLLAALSQKIGDIQTSVDSGLPWFSSSLREDSSDASSGPVYLAFPENAAIDGLGTFRTRLKDNFREGNFGAVVSMVMVGAATYCLTALFKGVLDGMRWGGDAGFRPRRGTTWSNWGYEIATHFKSGNPVAGVLTAVVGVFGVVCGAVTKGIGRFFEGFGYGIYHGAQMGFYPGTDSYREAWAARMGRQWSEDNPIAVVSTAIFGVCAAFFGLVTRVGAEIIRGAVSGMGWLLHGWFGGGCSGGTNLTGFGRAFEEYGQNSWRIAQGTMVVFGVITGAVSFVFSRIRHPLETLAGIAIGVAAVVKAVVRPLHFIFGRIPAAMSNATKTCGGVGYAIRRFVREAVRAIPLIGRILSWVPRLRPYFGSFRYSPTALAPVKRLFVTSAANDDGKAQLIDGANQALLDAMKKLQQGLAKLQGAGSQDNPHTLTESGAGITHQISRKLPLLNGSERQDENLLKRMQEDLFQGRVVFGGETGMNQAKSEADLAQVPSYRLGFFASCSKPKSDRMSRLDQGLALYVRLGDFEFHYDADAKSKSSASSSSDSNATPTRPILHVRRLDVPVAAVDDKADAKPDAAAGASLAV